MTCVCVWATVTHDPGRWSMRTSHAWRNWETPGGRCSKKSADGVINSSDCLCNPAQLFTSFCWFLFGTGFERLQFCNDWNRAWDPGPCCSRHLSKWRRRRSQSKQAKPSKLQWIWTPPPKKIDEDARMPPYEASSLAVLHVLGDEDALQVIEKTLQAQPWHLPE